MIISTNCVSLVSAVTTVPTSAPSRSTVTRSVISRTSSRSCETKSTEVPDSAAARMSENSRSTPSLGRKTVGSSRISRPRPCPTERISSIARTIASSARSTAFREATDALGSSRTP